MEFVNHYKVLPSAVRGFYMRRHWEDFAQVALLSVWQTLQEYDDSEEYPLQKIAVMRARSACVDYFRHVRYWRRRVPEPDHMMSLDYLRWTDEEAVGEADRLEPIDEGTEGSWFDRLLLWDELEYRLSHLPPRWREVLRPYFYEGLSAEECGARAGVSGARVGQFLRLSRLPSRAALASRSA